MITPFLACSKGSTGCYIIFMFLNTLLSFCCKKQNQSGKDVNICLYGTSHQVFISSIKRIFANDWELTRLTLHEYRGEAPVFGGVRVGHRFSFMCCYLL